MWLSALYICGCFLAFSACDSCPDPEDAASTVRLKPLGNCEDDENFCPYRLILPPLSIQLPKPFRELEKMARDLQNLKEVVNRLRKDCQECKDRQRVERGGWKDHGEDEERRTQNISSGERQSHSSNGEQMVRVVISTPPGDTEEIDHSSLERQGWNNDRRGDADQMAIDRSSEMSREIQIFDPSLEETPEDIYEVKQAFSPTPEEIHRDRNIQGELFESSIPRKKDIVQSVTHGSEMSREVKIFNLGETPEDISEEKQVFSSTTEERRRASTLQEGELLKSSIPRTKEFVQSPTHGKQHPNLLKERNVKNMSGILAVRRRVQNMTDTHGLNSNSEDANTKTMDLSISAGNRRIVNFSRAGGPLRPKTYINSRTKVSNEDRLSNPAVVRMLSQGGNRTVKTGFSPVRSGVMRVKETSPHIANSKPGTNSGLTPSTHDGKMTVTHPKPGMNIAITPSNEDEKINPKPVTNSRLTQSIDDEDMTTNPKPATNNGLTTSTVEKKLGTSSGLNPLIDDENVAVLNPKPEIIIRLNSSTHDEKMTTKPSTSSGLNPSIENENMAMINPNPDIKIEQIISTEDEKMTIKPGTNSRLTPSTDEKMTIVNPKPETNRRLTPSRHDGKMTNPKPATNRRLTPSTEDENMAMINPNPGIKMGQIIPTDDERMTINPKTRTNSRLTPSTDDGKMSINPKLGTNSRPTPSTEDKNMVMINPNPEQIISTDDGKIIINPKLGTNSGLNPSTEDENIAIVNTGPGSNSRLTPSTDDGKIKINPKLGTNSGLTPSTEDENIAIVNTTPGSNSRLTPSTDDGKMKINPKPGTKIRLNPSTEDENMAIRNTRPGSNSRLTPSTNDGKIIINPKLGTNRGLNPSTEDENIAIVNTRPGSNSRLTPSTDDGKMTNPRPGMNSRLTLSTDDGKMTNPRLGMNSRLTPSTDDGKILINPKLGTNSGLNPSTEDENIATVNTRPGSNSRQTSFTDDGKTTNPKPGTNNGITTLTDDETMTITSSKPGTNSRLTPSTDEKMTITTPKLGTNSRLTPSTNDNEKMTITNPKPRTNSRLTPSKHAEKMANRKDTDSDPITDSDPRTDSENDLKDPRQVTADGENFRKLNKTVITRFPTNLRTEDQGDVSHTAQTTNKSISSVMNRAEQPNLIKVEDEHVGLNASLVTSSTAHIRPSPGEADLTFTERQDDLTTVKVKETENGHLGSTVLDTLNEKTTNPHTSDETQLGTFTEEANEEKSAGSMKKDLLSNRKATQPEIDLLNPALVPSVKITSPHRKVSTASKIESPVVGQGTRILIPGSMSQPEEDVKNIQPNNKTNISKMREAGNVRFVKNITRVMPKLPGRHPTTGGPKLPMINKGNSSVVLPSNFSISGRNINFGRRNGSVMMKPTYVRRRPSFQSEPNASPQNRGFKANVSTVTHFITPTRETDRMGSHSDKNTSSVLKSLLEMSENAGEVQDMDSVKRDKEHNRETASTAKVTYGTEDSNNENSLHTDALDPLTGGKESKQLSLETTDQHPSGVESTRNLLNPQNSEPTPSTQQKELSSENEKTSNNARVSFTVTDHEESTKHIPALTNKHEDMVKNISRDTASTPVSFENTGATRKLELIELNEDKVQKYSGDVLSNPNNVNDVRGNNGEGYTIPVVLETLANVEEIKGSKVFSLSPEDTADGFKTIAVRDDVTLREQAENKILSTCVGECNTTPTQQPTTQSRPLYESERGRGLPQDCADYITKARKNGVYRVTPRSKNTPFHVFCDMETSRGGWTLIQHRFNGNTSFNHTWDEYKKGFGKLLGEFWLGNDKIHWLTQAKNMSLRIELEDFQGVREYAHYDHFHVANESQQYRLSIDGYSGTAGNAMQFNKKYNHDQKLFTTPDRDNDLYPSGNCGAYYSSGWWFDACMSANLNGKYYHTKYKGVRNGIFWGTWHNITMEYYPTNERQSFKTVRMMIRPQNYAN